VVEERGHLLRGRRAVRRRRRGRRLPRAHRQGRLPGRARRDLPLADAFYPTPNKDNGYDISDFYGVDPRLGTLGDLVEFLRAARERGIRVIADLVVNHTSDQHPWFQSARADERSPWRDFYVWADEQPEGPQGVVFPDAEDSNWNYDEVAGKWHLHRFYSHMPDLNIANPRVREISKVVGYWLELGLSGFRVDAAPFVIELEGTDHKRGEDPLHPQPAPVPGPGPPRPGADRDRPRGAARDPRGQPVGQLHQEPRRADPRQADRLGDDQRVEGRAAVRVAMQWTAGPAAGFTTGDPGRLLAEVLANRRDDPVEAGRPLALDGYGFRWLRLPPAEPG
jgi:glycosidase